MGTSERQLLRALLACSCTLLPVVVCGGGSFYHTLGSSARTRMLWRGCLATLQTVHPPISVCATTLHCCCCWARTRVGFGFCHSAFQWPSELLLSSSTLADYCLLAVSIVHCSVAVHSATRLYASVSAALRSASAVCLSET